MKKIVFSIILMIVLFSGCIHLENDEIENSSQDDLELIILSNQMLFIRNTTDDIIVSIILKNIGNNSVYIEKDFTFSRTLKYTIIGEENDYSEEYTGPIDDYQPEKEIIQINEIKELDFLVMNDERFQRIENETRENVFGNYSLEVSYSSKYTEGIIHSNIFRFEIQKN